MMSGKIKNNPVVVSFHCCLIQKFKENRFIASFENLYQIK
jgi:hypothetical protein